MVNFCKQFFKVYPFMLRKNKSPESAGEPMLCNIACYYLESENNDKLLYIFKNQF